MMMLLMMMMMMMMLMMMMLMMMMIMIIITQYNILLYIQIIFPFCSVNIKGGYDTFLILYYYLIHTVITLNKYIKRLALK